MMWFTLGSHRYERGYSRRCRQLGGQRIGPSSATIGLLSLPAAKPGVSRLDSPLRLTRWVLPNFSAEPLAIIMCANYRQPSWWHLPAPFLNFDPL